MGIMTLFLSFYRISISGLQYPILGCLESTCELQALTIVDTTRDRKIYGPQFLPLSN